MGGPPLENCGGRPLEKGGDENHGGANREGKKFTTERGRGENQPLGGGGLPTEKKYSPQKGM